MQSSTNLVDWASAEDEFDIELKPLSNGTMKRIYRSRVSINNLNQSRYYTIAASIIEVNQREINVASLLNMNGERFLSRGNQPWVPAPVGNAMTVPALEDGQTAEITTTVSGSFTISFDWKNIGAPGDLLEFLVDGAVQESMIGGGDGAAYMPVTYNQGASVGATQLSWRVTRAGGIASISNIAEIANLSYSQL